MKMILPGKQHLFILQISISVIFLCPQKLHAYTAAGSYQLENTQITARFNQSGLTSLYDRKLKKSYGFEEDGFAVTIDGHIITPGSAGPAVISKENDRLVYSFQDSSYSIRVIYEIKSSWTFISKQLEINSRSGQRIRVNEVTVLNEKLSLAVSSDYIPHGWWPGYQTKNYGAFLRFHNQTGLMALVQNPFLDYARTDRNFSLTYKPDMSWDPKDGAFLSDRACLGAYALSGRQIPVNMLPEWKWTGGIIPENGETEDEAEVNVFVNCVKAFIIDHTPRPINVHVAWCENDFQEDVSMSSGREVYKRIIDQAAATGSKYIVYTPTTSDLGTYVEAADGWQGEGFLWLGLGIKLRKNEWNPEKDTIPSSIREMLDYARKRDVQLLAYVYPGMPFQQNPDWLADVEEGGVKKQYANLGSRSLQDWLIHELTVFKEKTGIGGYSFDYTFLIYPGKSVYAQWQGWCRVLEALRQRFPDIIIDGRQTYQYYGPWSWVAGSYPHPTSTDEQPVSFVPFPDLHFDRASGDRMRYANYRYRIRDFCPQELMPGYITHQTPRFNLNQQVVREPFRIRDWDYLGWKYSLMSSIGTGGLNNVINMIPARDPEEYRHFSEADKTFFRKWLAWTKDNRAYLEKTRPIMGQPAIGKTDGSSAIMGNEGYIFLYNPNGRSLPAEFTLDASIGLAKAGQFVLRTLFPRENILIGKPGTGRWNYGDAVNIPMDGASCLVLKIEPAGGNDPQPLLYNVTGRATVSNNVLHLDAVTGEQGSSVEALVELPAATTVDTVYVNNVRVAFRQQGKRVTAPLHFAGDYFPHMKQAGDYNSRLTEGVYKASFHIPQRIMDQLNERKRQWPISWSEIDYDTPWLVPHRLLLFVQVAEPSDNMEISLKINNEPVVLRKAYSEIRKVAHTFLGFYADISSLQAGKEYNIELQLPPLAPGQFQGLFFENIETEYTDGLVNK